MLLELTIARRHLMSRERPALVSIITIISVLGVLVGVAALIVVIAIMDGAQQDYFKKLVDQFAHLEVWELDDSGVVRPVEHYEAVRKLVEEDPEVLGASPILQRFAMLKRDARFDNMSTLRPARIYGVIPALEDKVSKIVMQRKPTDADLSKNDPPLIGTKDPGDHEIVIGRELARLMRVSLGEEIFILTGKVAQTANGIVPKQSKLRVAGLYKSGIYDMDSMVAYTSLKTCQELNLLPDEADLVHARLKNPYNADAVKGRVKARLLEKFPDTRFVVRSWGELNPEFFQALFLEKLGMYIITMLIVIVASLNIISTLILTTMEKTRQIGILRAIGASRRSIARVFMLQGALIGAVGTGLGVAIGMAICWFLKHKLPKNILPEAVYGLDGLPVLVQWQTVLTIVTCSMLICLAASIIPAYSAARMKIVEALRHE